MNCAGRCLKLNPMEVDRLSQCISLLLCEENRRNEFRTFLSDREFNQEVSTLRAWEMINDIINDCGEQGIDDEARGRIRNKIRILIRLIDDDEVNLEYGQIRVLENCTREEDVKKIQDQIKTIEEEIRRLLKTVYDVYINYLRND